MEAKAHKPVISIYNEVLASMIAGSLAFWLGRVVMWLVFVPPVGWITYRLAKIPPPPGFFTPGFIVRNAFNVYDWGAWLGYIRPGVFWGVVLYGLLFRLPDRRKGKLISLLLLYSLFLYGMLWGYWFEFVRYPPRPEWAAWVLAWSGWFYHIIQAAGTVLFLWLLVPLSQNLLRRWFP